MVVPIVFLNIVLQWEDVYPGFSKVLVGLGIVELEEIVFRLGAIRVRGLLNFFRRPRKIQPIGDNEA